MKKWLVFGILLPLIFAIGLYLLSVDLDSILPDGLNKGKSNFERPSNVGGDIDGIPNDEEDDLPIGGGSGGQGESSGSGGGGSSGSGCPKVQISYSLGGFSSSSQCIEYSGPTCISKNLNCSVNIENFDSEVGGTFEIDFSFYYMNGSSRIIFGNSIKSSYVGPKNISKILTQKNFGFENGISDKDLECFTLTKSVPKKEVC